MVSFTIKQVTPDTLKGIFKKVRGEEDRYWKEDEIEDETSELLEDDIQSDGYEY